MSARGHVEKLRKQWYLRLQRPGPDGSPEQYRVALVTLQPIRSKAQARNLADEWLARQSPATLRPGLSVTFRQFAEKFLLEHAASLKASSRRRYAIAIGALKAELGSEQLVDIDRSRLLRALLAISRRCAPATTRLTRTIALLMLRQAREMKFGAHVIDSRDVRLPKNNQPERERPSFTAAQLEQLLDACEPPMRALFGCMAYAGLRAGEATAIEWRDIDFEARMIRVRRNATRAGIETPKTRGSTAAVPLTPKLKALLLEHRASNLNALGLVFTTTTGHPINADNLRRRQFQPLLRRLGLRVTGLHALRHSCPAILMSMGLGVELIRRFMRHAHLSTTERYTHSNDRDVLAAIDLAVSRGE